MAMVRSSEGQAVLGNATALTGALETYIATVENRLSEKDVVVCQLQAKVEEQRMQNELLQAQIDAAQEPKYAPLETSSSSVAHLPINSDDNWEQLAIVSGERMFTKKEWDSLIKKYEDDTNSYLQANLTLKARVQKLKETCKSWVEWGIERKRRTQKLQEENKTLQQEVSRLKSMNLGHSSLSVALSSPIPGAAGYEKNLVASAPPTPGSSALEPVATDITSLLHTTLGAPDGWPNSSQTTASHDSESGPPGTDIGKPILSVDDNPVFVSAKSTKKRKRNLSSTTNGSRGHTSKSADGSLERPVSIKEELYSSPARDSTIQPFTRTETLDLDEVGDRIDTPRKRRRLKKLIQRQKSFKTAAIDSLRQERSKSEPLEEEVQQRLTFQRIPLFADAVNATPRDTPILQRTHSYPALDVENRAISEPSHNMFIKNEFENESTPSRYHVAPLKQLSTNQCVLPRTSNATAHRSRARDAIRGSKALHLVAEDGNFVPKPKQPESPVTRRIADARLEELLENPSPAKHPFGQLTHPATVSIKNTATLPITPQAAKLLTSNVTPNGGMLPTPDSTIHGMKPSFRRLSPLPPFKNQTPRSVKPLRERPMSSLRKDNFKLNPNFNKDIVMFEEPGRTREERRHMAGCTDSACPTCGDQLQLLAAGLPVTVGSALFASTQDESLTEDERLLKYLLGADFSQANVAEMGSTERDELILKAKRKLISERHFRHRIKPGQRSKSPPGYWSVEMPTTQEWEAQKEEADRREKETVVERYKEAMKENGKWMFRDE